MNTEKPVILFVDDEEMILKSIRRELRKEPWECLYALSGSEALQILESRPVDIVVTDQRMPGMKGSELLFEVKNKYPDTLRVMMSGYSELDDLLGAINNGSVFHYFQKPWDKEEFLSMLRKWVRECKEVQSTDYKDLLFTVCHDLANYLSCIQCASSFVDARPDMEASKLSTLNSTILQSANMASTLLRRIRDLEATRSDQIQVHCKEHKVIDLVHKAMELLEDKIKAKGLEFDLSGLDPDATMYVDVQWFVTSILGNLFTNAIKFSDAGGRVAVFSEQDDSKVKIHVQDFGLGISESDLEKIQRYHRVSSREGTSGETGTGFGLPLFFRWVEKLNGTASVRSVSKSVDSQNCGTTWTISFPSRSNEI